MARRAKKKNGWKTLAIVLTIVLVLGVGVFLTKDFIVAKAEEKVQDALIENVLESVINSDSDAAKDAAQMAKDIYDGMSDEDKATCRELVNSNLTTENVANVAQYVKDGDVSGLENYVKSSVSDSDKEAIKSLYNKYKDQIQ